MNTALKTAAPIEPNHDFGTVVDVRGDQLMTIGDSGLERTHTVEHDAQVICRGKDGKVSDLTVGSRVRIVERPDDAQAATAVECLRAPGSVLD